MKSYFLDTRDVSTETTSSIKLWFREWRVKVYFRSGDPDTDIIKIEDKSRAMKKLVIKKCETDSQLLLIDIRQTLGRYLYLGEKSSWKNL